MYKKQQISLISLILTVCLASRPMHSAQEMINWQQTIEKEAEMHYNAGIQAFYAGQHDDAITSFFKVLEHFQRLESHTASHLFRLADVYGHLAKIFHQRNDYHGAIEMYTRGVDVFEELIDRKKEDIDLVITLAVSASYNYWAIAQCFAGLGDYQQELFYYQAAVKLLTDIDEGHKSNMIKHLIAERYKKIGNYYKRHRDSANAAAYYRAAIQVLQNIKVRPSV